MRRHQLEGSRGREVVDLAVFQTGEPEPEVPPLPRGTYTTIMEALPLRELRAKKGEVFQADNPTTGRWHRVSLKRFAHLDPDTTYIEVRFYFTPAPFASREAQLLRARAIDEIRARHDMLLQIHDDAHYGENLPPGSAGVPSKESMLGRLWTRISAEFDLSRSIGLLTQDEIRDINNEYAAKRPDLFRPTERPARF